MAESASLCEVFDLALEARHVEAVSACNALVGTPECTPALAARVFAILAFSRVLEGRSATAATAALSAEQAASRTTDAGAHLAALAAASLVRAMGAPLDGAIASIDFDTVWSRRAALESLSDEDHAIIGSLMIEAALSSGRLREAQVLARDLASGQQLGSHRLQVCATIALSRSLAFQGKIAEALASSRRAVTLADALADTLAGTLGGSGGRSGGASSQALAHAILAYCEAQVDNRAAVEEETIRVLELVAKPDGHLAVGAWALSAFALADISHISRATRLLLTAAGGQGLLALPVVDRARGYDILVTDAIERGDLKAARAVGRRLAPLENHDTTTAVVQSMMSRIDLAIGDVESAAERAALSSARESLAVAEHNSLSFDAEHPAAAALRHWTSGELARLRRKLKPDASASWSSLSERERQIAALAAAGYSHPEIGRALYISERTVQSHISRVLTALGASSRSKVPAVLELIQHSAVELPQLTDRQRDVAELIAAGLPNREISERLDISGKTVEKHVQGIFMRWGVESRTAIARVMRDVSVTPLAS